MTQSNTIELAKQGNPQAIAALITHSLKARSIRAKANLKGECLRIMLESAQVPDKQAMAQFIHQNLNKLRPKSIKTVKIYGRQIGEEVPAWSHKIELDSQSQAISNSSDPIALDEASTPANLSNSILVAARNPQSINETTQLSLNPKATRDSVKNSRNVSPEKLKVTGIPKHISQILLAFLWLRIGFDSLFVIYSLAWATSYYIYDVLGVADATGFFAYLLHRLVIGIDSLWNPLSDISIWIYRISVVILLVWLHRLHAYLRKIFSNYPISPWGAIIRFVIPIYSLWGIWNTFNTIAKRLKQQAGELASRGVFLQRWIPWLLIALVSSNILNRLYWFQARRIGQEDFSPWFFFVRNSAYLFLGVVWLQIVRVISKAITEEAIIEKKISPARIHNQIGVSHNKGDIFQNENQTNFSLKAILCGLSLDILGSSIINSLLGTMTAMHFISQGTESQKIDALLYSSTTFCLTSITIGLLFTILGGFWASHIATAFKLKHAFATGTLLSLIGAPFVFAQPQIPYWYSLTVLILTIPAAVIGGYLQQQISFSRI